jgi:hypothetical protein
MQKQPSKQGGSRLSGGRAQVKVSCGLRTAGFLTLLLGSGTTFAQLTLPYNGSGSSSSTLFQITQNGTGRVAAFFLNNSSATQPALFVQTSAPGPTIFGKSVATSGFTYGARFEATGPLARGVLGYALSTTGESYGVYGLSDSVSGTGVFGWTRATTGTTYGGYFQSSSSSGTGVYGEALAASGSTYGVYGKSRSPTGVGVYGYASATTGITYGGKFRTDSPDGYGVLSEGRLRVDHNSTTDNATLRLHELEADFARLEFTNTNTARKWHIAGLVGTAVADDRLNFWNSGVGDILSIRGDGTVVATNPSTAAYAFALHGIISSASPGALSAAVRGQNNGTGALGIGVWGSQDGSGWGVYGTSVSGRGVYGYASATSGFTYGVYGESASTSGRGVYGYAFATSGATYGGQFVSDSTSGTGVYGRATATSGAAWGVWGRSASTASSAYGVYGAEPPEGAGHAVYADGTLAATGTKSFQIDHPLHPETHYLNHFCTEGPEPYNVYRGTVVLDANGEAWVRLPDYFEALNRDPSYHLTAIGAPMPNLHVAVEIQGNRFKIAGGVPGKKVSWEVKAIRNDLWVQRYGYQTEQEKEDAIKGKYLNPELYGQPKELGIHYRPEPEPTPPQEKVAKP